MENTTPLFGLHNGDYIVHLNHGVGLFRGLETITTPTTTPTGEAGEEITREYLVLEYHGGDKLYIPADQTDRVRPFVGAATAPTLDKLGGQSWAKSYNRARREAEAVAKELFALYQARMARKGHAYAPDTPEQSAMEAAFPYDETPDQLAAIGDVKRDLEAPRPMDRLLVGDVGYGKTEVAVRAAFKVANAGRQVAVLCPTSVLAAQHFQTFSARLGEVGNVHVALLSRFVSPEAQKATLDAIAQGKVNIVVGTHRLLSDDVAWKNLGLVIVDEEQRFGVSHKEKLKQLRETVDVLTMTATPIPRTLSLATTGVLDVSVIADPPHGRAPIETALHAHDDAAIRAAILCELERGGQAYYLHNRVESISDTLAHLAELVPEARFGVAHGQMAEDELEEAMHQFYEHAFDVLVCTTIIEIGLNVCNANTLIVEDADRFGLAQLYQLRGRVGRSDRQAYAALLVRREGAGALTPEATARLTALREFTAPGSGHQIAQRDLQLRGAGSLVGVEQSGTSAAGAVGYDLFVQMLEQAVRSQRGQKPDPRTVPLPTVEMPTLAAAIPETYVPDTAERMARYEQAASVRSAAELTAFRDELTARHGELPAPAQNLLTLTRLRLRCRAAGIKTITAEAGGGHLTLTFRRGAELSPARVAALNHELGAHGFTFAPDKAVLHVAPAAALATVQSGVESLARTRRQQKTPAS